MSGYGLTALACGRARGSRYTLGLWPLRESHSAPGGDSRNQCSENVSVQHRARDRHVATGRQSSRIEPTKRARSIALEEPSAYIKRERRATPFGMSLTGRPGSDGPCELLCDVLGTAVSLQARGLATRILKPRASLSPENALAGARTRQYGLTSCSSKSLKRTMQSGDAGVCG